MQASASTSWINPFGRASFSVEDDTYIPPGSLPSSRRPSAATIISTLLHGVKESSGSDESAPQTTLSGRRPSAILRAWKGRRGSHSQSRSAPSPPTGFAPGRRKSSALTRVLQPSAFRTHPTTTARVDEHSLSNQESDSRRRSLSIVCRGDRTSAELDAKQRAESIQQPSGGAKTAAMAIRDTWLYAEHQWERNGRKGSVSTIATSPSYSMPRKSFAVGLDEEGQWERKRRDDSSSVVSLSLTEEIALYTADAGKSKQESVPSGAVDRTDTEVPFRMPDWSGSRRRSTLPMLSAAPAVMIADPFSLQSSGMQRMESGAVDPMLNAVHTPTSQGASVGHGSLGRRSSTVVEGIQWSTPQWNVASPFNPDATKVSISTSFAAACESAANSAYHSVDDQSPTAPNFPPPAIAVVQPSVAVQDAKRRATAYYDASPLPIVDEVPRSPTSEFPLPPSRSTATITRTPRSPRSPLSPKLPKSFGHSEAFELGTLQRRKSYSLPRLAAGHTLPQQQQQQQQYDDDASSHVPTPRLVGLEFGETAPSPMSSNFEPQTPSGAAATFPALVDDKRGVEEDLHAQFCSVLLLDLGDGRAMRLSESEAQTEGGADEARGDASALLVF